MLLDQLQEKHVPVYSIGKIADIFLHRGIDRYVKTKNNGDGMHKISVALREQTDGSRIREPGRLRPVVRSSQRRGRLCLGAGIRRCLAAVAESHGTEILVILTADHGCDPTTPSTDHSREYTPLLVFGPQVKPGVNLGTRATLSDIGQTVAENFGTQIPQGTSFLNDIWKGSQDKPS